MNTITDLPAPRPPATLPDHMKRDDQLREAAIKLEATFLAEMVKKLRCHDQRIAGPSVGRALGESEVRSDEVCVVASENMRASVGKGINGPWGRS